MTAKDKICGIYIITSPSACIYVGQSTNCYYRVANYKGLDCKRQTRLYNSIIKYGWGAHNFSILHTCLPDELNFWERFYIRLFNSFDSEHGLNLTDGGKKTGVHSQETKKKRSVSLTNTYASGLRERPCAEKNGMYGNGHKLAGDKNGRYGKEVSEETRNKIRDANLLAWELINKNGGRKLTEDHKKKISESNKGIKKNVGNKHPTSTIARMRETWKKKAEESGRIIGVYKKENKKSTRWVTHIRVNGKSKYIGVYDSEKDATIAHNEAGIRYHKDYATMNNVNQ